MAYKVELDGKVFRVALEDELKLAAPIFSRIYTRKLGYDLVGHESDTVRDIFEACGIPYGQWDAAVPQGEWDAYYEATKGEILTQVAFMAYTGPVRSTYNWERHTFTAQAQTVGSFGNLVRYDQVYRYFAQLLVGRISAGDGVEHVELKAP